MIRLYVDIYCERTAPGLWGEPFNATSNVAFLIASGLLLWLLAGQRRAVPVSVRLLPVLLAVVGVCSLSFHTFANRPTELLDTVAILVFILSGVVILAHWMWNLPWRWAWLAAPVYVAFAFGLNAALVAIGGEQLTLAGYVPALVGLLLIGVAVRATAPADARRFGGWLALTAAVFAVSVTMRTLDQPVCDTLPIGTHFMWHCLNATVLFLVSYTVIRRWQEKAATSTPVEAQPV